MRTKANADRNKCKTAHNLDCKLVGADLLSATKQHVLVGLFDPLLLFFEDGQYKKVFHNYAFDKLMLGSRFFFQDYNYNML